MTTVLSIQCESSERRQKSMRDGATCAVLRLKWRLARRALRVDMNPLEIPRGARKLVNDLLCHLEPLADADFRADFGC